MLSKMAIKAIQYYKKRWAARFAGCCLFEPSCSQYGIQVIENYGFWVGVLKTGRRLLRCRPPNGGYDPVLK